ncbi:hypothetical protein LH128_19079 [Sphingomonas sp. LH128]|uniref:Single-stranded DNA endonuclease n=1 Tax=Novosphingobium resinovorum TaxID=158500 RepID=A0A1D8AFC9_9SPHN|nr:MULTISPECIES: DUF2958 domain-containing protein [Sphingomonadaceae]AOR80809.1 hypothetical protein BES08_28830 [Novosphingobium resinovorum]EJU11404.1 hypothetical protein LH128_19079 [Sphingomonas sp. LH128]MBF7015667.1 DUF2958 domain-containing protein [Novosphingobium sp. HR1a]
MSLLSRTASRMLLANARMSARHPAFDPYPLVRLFNPLGPGTWLVSELYPDGDTLFGLADLGFGCPELGCFSLREVAGIHLPFGMGIERDRMFRTRQRMSRWTEVSRLLGSIGAAQAYLDQMERAFGSIPEIPLKRG